MKNISIISLFLIIAICANQILCDYENVDKLTENERRALTRDNLARENPDALLNGFFPAWAVVIFLLSGAFLVFATVSGVLSFFGFRNPNGGEGFRVISDQ